MLEVQIGQRESDAMRRQTLATSYLMPSFPSHHARILTKFSAGLIQRTKRRVTRSRSAFLRWSCCTVDAGWTLTWLTGAGATGGFPTSSRQGQPIAVHRRRRRKESWIWSGDMLTVFPFFVQGDECLPQGRKASLPEQTLPGCIVVGPATRSQDVLHWHELINHD